MTATHTHLTQEQAQAISARCELESKVKDLETAHAKLMDLSVTQESEK